MARDKENKKDSATRWNIRRGIEDMRLGLDEDARDASRVNLAKMARVIGFALAVAAVLYMVAALRSFGIFG